MGDAAGTLEPGPRCGRGRPLRLSVQLLDGSVETFAVEPEGSGQALLTQVWKRLNLAEGEYFGLELQDAPGSWVWLEPGKPLARQVRRSESGSLRLAVKFFPPDPGQLQEEHTRYLFTLQLKRDLLEGRLACSDSTAALLAAHLLQAEIGDYNEALDREHLKANAYLPAQERALETVLELHRRLAGQTPAESDFQALEVARKLAMYGVRLHAAADREGAGIQLAVAHAGVLVFQNSTKINSFSWARVRKLSFKRRRFLIKLHPEAQGPHQDTLEFLLGSRDACKRFWKACVEHHGFFRLREPPRPRPRPALFRRGSSFTYSGRTQKQLAERGGDGRAARAPAERRRPGPPTPTAEAPRQSESFTRSPPPASGPFGLRDVGGPLPEAGLLPPCGQPAAERSQGAAASDGCAPPPPGRRRPRGAVLAGGERRPPGPSGRRQGRSGPSPAGGPPQGRRASLGPRPAGSPAAGLRVPEEFRADEAALCARARPAPAPAGPWGPAWPRPCPGPLEAGCALQGHAAFWGVHPADTAELLEVKARAGPPPETSSLGSSGSRASSLGTLPPACGLSARSPSSAAGSEASSPDARRTRSGQLCLVLDRLEQLGCPAAAAGGSPSPGSGSGSDSDSWGVEAGTPPSCLLGGGPFAASGGRGAAFDFQSALRSLAPAAWPDTGRP